MSKRAAVFTVENYQIEESIGYLLARSRAMLVKSSDESLAEYGITHAQGAILLMLSTGKYSTAADLARETYTDAASTKRMIDRLAARDLITREPCAHDRRLMKLHLTADGLELSKKMPKAFCGVLNKHFSDFSPEEIGFLKSMLRRLLASNAPAEKTH
ncbi:DNA-binding MarR family transcriptional regulator [Collimonas sp. PA-H2]|uniref:MarR family winged helix-turn-helix transcriptional regulator n=1 Tax=Collimonas sp. PA-H2 TaxID=1881062 RepID=UPI000BF35091|nr:MarR family winged helix-turn-helix transcriptional regulator [Collimonas sp. PA-H2]PFH12027.1 DNA-binding MarR family transcriptional regulator [Collimonas sp. PA-H2]